MRTSIIVLVLGSILGAFSVGCTSTGLSNIAFEPRVYPFVPELGSDGPASSGNAK